MPNAASQLLRLHFLVDGRVQGVGYRNATQKTALKLGLTGWVRNLSDGKVEVLAEGPEHLLENLLQWAHRGPLFAKVTEVVVQKRERIDQAIIASFDIAATL